MAHKNQAGRNQAGHPNQTGQRKQTAPNHKKQIWILGGTILVLFVFGFLIRTLTAGDSNVPGGDLTIVKSDVTETAQFYPYQAGGTEMEIVAVKASDGSVRTAFNTCQVCFNSGKGYYEQEGDELVCQNCGNRFQFDKVEIIKGGCNPVPITEEYKTDDGTNITIPQAFLQENKALFGNWSK